MSFDLNLLPDGGLSWLDASGPDSSIVLSTRIRLARNVAGHVFTSRGDRDTLEDVYRMVHEAATDAVLPQAVTYRLDQMRGVDRQVLHERHLVSRELAGLDRQGGARTAAALLTDGAMGIMVNEEDHLRLQGLQSGFQLERLYGRLATLDGALGERIPFAFHSEFGYLTACPTNAGTGLRASVLIHLPGLVLTKEINKVLQGLAQVGLTFRGLYGEGSEVLGNFFQLSNQTTLGKSEAELLDHLGRMVRMVLAHEHQAREVMERSAPAVVADRVWRAYGILRHARTLSFEETMNFLSGVRLGVGLNLISGVSVYTLNRLLVYTQPGHLAHAAGIAVTDPELAVHRATLVRTMLDDDATRPPGATRGAEAP
ncbi:MAG: protein arginine kinase [Gemmatimonadales bacterium]